MSEPYERLQRARIDAGFESAREAAMNFGWGISTYTSHENGQRGLRPDAARRYARAFKVKPEWLLYGAGKTASEDAMPVAVPVVGRVAAGLWLDADTYDYADDAWIPAVRSPEHRNGRQVAYKVEGPSMNRVLPDGVYAIGVLFPDAGDPRDGDIVVLRRERGGLVETTIKRYVVSSDGVLLMPESDDPRYQKPINLRASEDDTSVQIHAIVVGSYKPLWG